MYTGPLFPKAVGDANANAMDKALDALNSWLAKANESQAARCDLVFPRKLFKGK